MKITVMNKQIDPDTILKIIKPYKYVSFDIFDTLLKRNVEKPTDVFEVIERKAGNNFKKIRIEAEQKARHELITGDKKEITLKDIYSYIPGDTEKLQQLELQTERQLISDSIVMHEVFNKCIEEGKKIYLVSDMYLDRSFIEELLKKTGIKGYTKIYLSCEYQAVKADGSLFKVLLNKEKIKPDSIIHLGDSYKSDYLSPKKIGINAVYIPKEIKNNQFFVSKDDSIEYNILKSFINNTVDKQKSIYYQYGYCQFGKLLWKYSNWIHDLAIKKHLHKIFFLSRDGYIMKQAYDLCFCDPNIETRYLEVSRKSLRIPILWMDSSPEKIINLVTNAMQISIKSVFDGTGLDITNYNDELKAHGFTANTIFERSSIQDNTELKLLIKDLYPDIYSNSKKQFELLKKYLDDQGVRGEFGIVDIGYAGSMQRYLQQALDKLNVDAKIAGFYLCVSNTYHKYISDGYAPDLNGYLFDFYHEPEAIDCRSSFVGLFETLFLEKNGSVKCYISNENGDVMALRYPYEYKENGEYTQTYFNITDIQNGALEFIKNASSNPIVNNISLSNKQVFDGIYKTGTNPDRKDLAMFSDIVFYDEGISERLAAPKPIKYYLKNINQLKNDFLRSRWKIGFMKKLFKANLPYQSMYRILKRLSK